MERTFTLLFGAWLCLLVACGSKGTGASGPAKADSVMAYRICSSSGWDTLFIRPVMGYRFSIRGDFDGDGKTELLTEHYVDSNGQETNKFYWGMLDYDDLVDRINKRNLRSFLLSDNVGIDTLHIGGGLGLSLLRNEGDLNGDGRADLREKLYDGFGFRDTHGMSSNYWQWIDGWVYGAHGFANPSEVTDRAGRTVKLTSGNTYRFRPDGSRFELVTHGQTNPYGLAFDS
eukprot:gene8575-10918_t